VLSSRVAVFGGAISYGFYLFHLAVLHQVQDHFDIPPFSGGFVKAYVLTAAITVVLATGAYYVVEKPVLGLKDRPISSLWRRGREPAVSSPGAKP
jgi:peptidoglycan/LPS O-acetylase OafA/YrhL